MIGFGGWVRSGYIFLQHTQTTNHHSNKPTQPKKKKSTHKSTNHKIRRDLTRFGEISPTGTTKNHRSDKISLDLEPPKTRDHHSFHRDGEGEREHYAIKSERKRAVESEGGRERD